MSKPDKQIDLPHPGTGRWWKIELVTGQSAKPLKISLMESYSRQHTGPSRALQYKRANAQPDSVKRAAEALLYEVGGYADYVGEVRGNEN